MKDYSGNRKLSRDELIEQLVVALEEEIGENVELNVRTLVNYQSGLMGLNQEPGVRCIAPLKDRVVSLDVVEDLGDKLAQDATLLKDSYGCVDDLKNHLGRLNLIFNDPSTYALSKEVLEKLNAVKRRNLIPQSSINKNLIWDHLKGNTLDDYLVQNDLNVFDSRIVLLNDGLYATGERRGIRDTICDEKVKVANLTLGRYS
jgi:hypothetical protein